MSPRDFVGMYLYESLELVIPKMLTSVEWNNSDIDWKLEVIMLMIAKMRF